MDERIKEILNLLIKNPDFTVNEISERLSLTKRQIDYAIQQYNVKLHDANLTIIKKKYGGRFVLPFSLIQHLQRMESESSETDILSVDERAYLILISLITNIKYVSLDHLTYILDVSKNTVITDLKNAEKIANEYYMTIKYDRNLGYHLMGNELHILELLSNTIQQYQIVQKNYYKNLFQIADISELKIVSFINTIEQILDVSYSDESFDYLQTNLYYILNRACQLPSNYEPFFENHVKDTKEFQVVSNLLKNMSWEIPESYKEWIVLTFLVSNYYKKNWVHNEEGDFEKRLLEYIAQMIEHFQEQTFITIDNRDEFEKRLLSHLRPAVFRIRYGLSLGGYALNSLIKDSNHAILIQLMKEIVLPLERWMNKTFPIDELELLTYYFGSQLRFENNIASKPRGVIVCTNGVMVSKLVRANMEKLFPEIYFLASLSVRDFYKFEADYDLVFTTTPLKSSILQFMIDPLMTYQQQISLRYRVLSDLGITKVDQAMDELLTIIRKYANITNPVSLREELQYFLIKEEGSTPLDNFKVLPSLTYYLRPSYVQIVEEEMSWERAVEVACRPLLEHQIIDSRFIADCLDQIRQQGYAGYLGMKTCIPHTTVDKGVISDGVSILVCKKPIRFPNGEDVSLILPLSFFDLTKHLRAINQIADIAKDDSLIEQLLIADDEKTVYQLLRQRS
ncbi:PTS sugar transporter subunit IIA [Enterococcus raffinosus]|uniref:BglG family transcription antiterminator n=1 Tax=Enterococcus raffinosus TaxID=71452 RepID=UPI00288CB3F9|nr:PTS sugar transporter subunit IIA [Enterococcus raffinosus]MDT2557025.1 PTS sugar transporter subunit IIA [Enterococcus raffinosus]